MNVNYPTLNNTRNLSVKLEEKISEKIPPHTNWSLIFATTLYRAVPLQVKTR